MPPACRTKSDCSAANDLSGRGQRRRLIGERVMLAIAVLFLWSAAGAQAPDVPQLERALRDNPSSLPSKIALAEAYLHECRIEESLKLWRQIAAADPGNERAKLAFARLNAAQVNVEEQLDVIESLIGRGSANEVSVLLEQAAGRTVSDPQKARVGYLRGRVAAAGQGQVAAATAAFEGVVKQYSDVSWGGLAAIELARLEARAGLAEAARRRLDVVSTNGRLPEAVRQKAAIERVMLDLAGLSLTDQQAALEQFLKATKDAAARRQALWALIKVVNAQHEGWCVASVKALGEILGTNPPAEEVDTVVGRLFAVASESRDAQVLNELWAVAEGEAPAGAGQGELRFEWGELGAFTLLAQAAIDLRVADARASLGRAERILRAMDNEQATFAQRRTLAQLRGRALLIEAQKVAVLDGPAAALPVLLKARDHYLAAMAGDPSDSFVRLAGVGKLLEQMKEWETAAAIYRQVAMQFPHLSAGRDALLKLAQLYGGPLDAPMQALEVYAEYAARYPAELPYRQLAVGERLKRLGYANIFDFQKRNGLKADGLFGPGTQRKLEDLEGTFDLIAGTAAGDVGASLPSLVDEDGDGVQPAPLPSKQAKPAVVRAAPVTDAAQPGQLVRGQFVHMEMFAIAQRLEQAGQFRDAIAAHQLCLALFPTKAQASGSLLAIARMFRDNLMFDEALGAYRRLMDDYPKGVATSGAYIEAAQCLENLGQWKQARELYELYAKNFPKYEFVAMARERMGRLDELTQYQDFITTNPASPKLAEAQYQIASILYKKFNNQTKAAVEFGKVAEQFPQHVRAADALFSAGTAYLKAENFPAARQQFALLVARYPDSRLADDGQYWIGHTYEYSARSLGKLDRKRIVLKQRGLRERAELIADVGVRRAYFTGAAAGAEASADVWGGDVLGVLTSGSRRDRANADLFAAIKAYREVVDRFKMGDMAGNALLRIGVIYTDYLNDPDSGAQAYQELLAHYPGSKEAVDALFEVGAYQVKQKKFDEAIKSYQQFIYNYQNEPKVEDAMIAIARCHAEKKAWDKALDAYQSYLNKFPRGKLADFARAQVEWIRMYHF